MAGRQESTPLMRLEQGQAIGEECQPSELSEMECLEQTSTRSDATTPRFKRMAAFAVVALGTMVIVCAMLFKSTGGPLWARVQSSTRLADGSCIAPRGFCKGKVVMKDCDSDDVKDPYCDDGSGTCSCVGSSNDCQEVTDKCLPNTMICARPEGYCAGPSVDKSGTVRIDELVYSERDCDGDGQPDPFCQKADAVTGEKSCGCLQSSNDCFDNWPEKCPDISYNNMNELPQTVNEVAAQAPDKGTLMFMDPEEGDRVNAGDEVASVIVGEKIIPITAPASGTVTDTLALHPGDDVKNDQKLLIVTKGEGKTAAPTPAPTTPVTTAAPFIPGIKLPTGPGITLTGLKGGTLDAGGTFKGWKTAPLEAIKKGDPVAEFGVDGKTYPINYDGPDGMVFAQQKPLDVGVGLTGGADLITTGRGVFDGYSVEPGQDVKTGDTLAQIKTGGEPIKIKAEKAGGVTKLGDFKKGDYIGFDQKLDGPSFCTVAGHLPFLPPAEEVKGKPWKKGTETEVEVGKGGPTHAGKDGWVILKEWKVANGEEVNKGDTIAIVAPILPDGKEGPAMNVTAEADGWVSKEQPISPGTAIGPDDDLADIMDKKPAGSSFPWWLLLLLLLCCCLLLLLLCCRKKEEEKPAEPVPVVAPPPPVEQPKPAPAPVVVAPEPTPAPVAAPAAAPPPGVPIYFDNKPYYFEYHPIGIKFHTQAPIKIDQFIFNSYGKTLGLKEGQKLTRIKDVDVRDDHSYTHVDKMLLDATTPLPWWPLRVDFRTPTQEVKTYYFVGRPLGILFTQHLPIKVEKFRPQSLAQRKGVQAGWEIVRIADEDTSVEGMKKLNITSNKAGYEHVDKHLLEGLAHLPFWAVKIEWRTPAGQTTVTEHTEKPLGVHFTKTTPAKVDKFKTGSDAPAYGIEIGWEILRICDEDVRDHAHVEKDLDGYFQHLPNK